MAWSDKHRGYSNSKGGLKVDNDKADVLTSMMDRNHISSHIVYNNTEKLVKK